MIDEERIVREILQMWGQGIEQTKAAWAEHCVPEMVWSNSARGSISGLDNCLHAIDEMFSALDAAYVTVPIRTLHAATGVAYVERSDDLYRADGSLIVAVPVVGVVEFDHGKIVQWRDYCDDWILKMQVAAGG